ncbi:iron(III) transport system substrate-binding protein [Murinocardiopsis flavida]|uniref:Iron(III) transport system substrate-binding protein n=1 Tax=Murinocardiopsis flavida TaxID=645275 RepID=A0A2P8DLC3_9ACTN|nr:extracellular solute-binding protein [Murinocardiopsis flavida]PSK98032.1 iron(III) transport system substrate-binding protein [Murinocardiopsis flavida]
MRTTPPGLTPGLAAAVALALVTAACGTTGRAVQDSGVLAVGGEVIAGARLMAAARDEGEVSVYTSLNDVGNDAMKDAFERDTGIAVEGVQEPNNRLFERIEDEKRNGSLSADVIAMPDESLVHALVSDGVFAEHTVPADDDIPARFKAPDRRFYTLSSAATVIAYNSDLVGPGEVPRSWRELPNAGRGEQRIGLLRASQGAGGWGLALFLRKRFGERYLRELAASEPSLTDSADTLAGQLGRGEVGIAAIRLPEVGRLQQQGAPVEYLWPADGAPMFNFYIGAVAKAGHSDAARVYLNWALSEHGQSVLAEEGIDYPVNTEASRPELYGDALPSIDEVDPYFAHHRDWIDLREEWTADWDRAFDG